MEAIEIRPLSTDDRSAFQRFFDGLSERSRYLRFFSPMPSLPKRTLAWMTDVDHSRHEAVAAWADGRLVGEARYVAFEDDSAELAVTVTDEWQGRGIGRALMARVIEAAGLSGFCRLTANALSENRPIAKLLTGFGFSRSGSDGLSAEWQRDACPAPPASS